MWKLGVIVRSDGMRCSPFVKEEDASVQLRRLSFLKF